MYRIQRLPLCIFPTFILAVNSLFISPVLALDITAPGVYTINSRVDQIIISESISQDVTVNVISGGVVEGDIGCGTPHYYNTEGCQANITVSGYGAVSGDIIGPALNINLQDYAWVNSAGTSQYGSLLVQDHARIETMQDGSTGVSQVSMTGGSVGRYLWAENAIIAVIGGGIFEDTLGQFEMYLSMSDGQLQSGVYGNNYLSLDIKGGQIWGNGNSNSYSRDVIHGSSEYGTTGSITGGAFNARSDEYLLGLYGGSNTLSIYGGLFGNINPGSGFYLGGNQVLDMYGIDLVLAEGILSGHLRDGSYIDVAVEVGERWGGELNIYNVPEPASFALLSLGIVAVNLSKRRNNPS